MAMTKTAKNHPTVPSERESALKSISERWHGDLSAYLDAISRAKEAAAAERDEEGIVRSRIAITRLARMR